MIHAHIEEKRSVPIWAAIGAPLLGVPLMVALLALTATVERAPAGEAEMGARTEQIEVQTVERAIEPGSGCVEASLKRG